MNILLRLLRPLARATGLSARLKDGRLVPRLSVCLPNFLAQRILRINGDCPWAVHFTSRVIHPNRMTVGHWSAYSFAVSGSCYFLATNGIHIEDDVIFSHGVTVVSGNHDPSALHAEALPSRPVRIGKGCWLGANATILTGVELGERVIVGAGSVVTKSFPSDVVIAGNPARIIRSTLKEASHAFTHELAHSL